MGYKFAFQFLIFLTMALLSLPGCQKNTNVELPPQKEAESPTKDPGGNGPIDGKPGDKPPSPQDPDNPDRPNPPPTTAPGPKNPNLIWAICSESRLSQLSLIHSDMTARDNPYTQRLEHDQNIESLEQAQIISYDQGNLHIAFLAKFGGDRPSDPKHLFTAKIDSLTHKGTARLIGSTPFAEYEYSAEWLYRNKRSFLALGNNQLLAPYKRHGKWIYAIYDLTSLKAVRTVSTIRSGPSFNFRRQGNKVLYDYVRNPENIETFFIADIVNSPNSSRKISSNLNRDLSNAQFFYGGVYWLEHTGSRFKLKSWNSHSRRSTSFEIENLSDIKPESLAVFGSANAPQIALIRERIGGNDYNKTLEVGEVALYNFDKNNKRFRLAGRVPYPSSAVNYVENGLFSIFGDQLYAGLRNYTHRGKDLITLSLALPDQSLLIINTRSAISYQLGSLECKEPSFATSEVSP